MQLLVSFNGNNQGKPFYKKIISCVDQCQQAIVNEVVSQQTVLESSSLFSQCISSELDMIYHLSMKSHLFTPIKLSFQEDSTMLIGPINALFILPSGANAGYQMTGA